jgi:hypothetical protein
VSNSELSRVESAERETERVVQRNSGSRRTCAVVTVIFEVTASL